MLDKIFNIFFSRQTKKQRAVFIRKDNKSFNEKAFKMIQVNIFPTKELREDFYRTMAMRAHL